MKWLVFSFFLIAAFTCGAQQNIAITYHYYLNVDTLQKTFVSFRKAYLFSEGDSMAVFAFDKTGVTDRIDLNKLSAHHNIFKRMGSNDYYAVSHFHGRDRNYDRLVRYNDDTTKWQVTGDSMYILNTLCYAATKLKHIAWFAPSIPFKSGPWCEGGLPGLILNLYRTDTKTLFEAVEINNLIPPIIYPKNKKIVSAEEYSKEVLNKNTVTAPMK